MARSRMPHLVRFMLLHAALGFGLAALFVAALLWANPGNVAAIMLHSSTGPWPVALLWFFSGLTFGSAQIGNAVMLLAEDPPVDGGGRLRRLRLWLSLVPAPVPAPAPIPGRRAG